MNHHGNVGVLCRQILRSFSFDPATATSRKFRSGVWYGYF
jgi:hypothetical protein